MLVLSRKAQEVIRLGHDIKIEILTINGNEVKIGITADKSIPVHREEVYISIHQKVAAS